MYAKHTTPNVFPATAGLEVFDMITVMADRTGEHYTAMNLWYQQKGEYLTLVPCDPSSNSPRIKVSRNMWGAYILNHDFSYAAHAQALFASHIAMMEEIEEIAANRWDIWDYEGFAVTLNIAPAPQPAPAAPIVPAIVPAIVPPVAAPAAQPAPRVIITPIVINVGDGRFLTATTNGWSSESRTKAGTTHETSLDGSKCSCPGNFYHRRRGTLCWHRTAVYTHNAHRNERDTALPISRPRKRGLEKMFK